jgi:hypothetical protein
MYLYSTTILETGGDATFLGCGDDNLAHHACTVRARKVGICRYPSIKSFNLQVFNLKQSMVTSNAISFSPHLQNIN